MQNTPQNFHKKLLGDSGEKLAVKLLKKQGYKILEKNYTTHFGEADIIALYDNTVVFVEVKTRLSQKFGSPADAVNLSKQKRYIKLAKYYFQINKLLDSNARFDVIEVFCNTINHIESAFTL